MTTLDASGFNSITLKFETTISVSQFLRNNDFEFQGQVGPFCQKSCIFYTSVNISTFFIHIGALRKNMMNYTSLSTVVTLKKGSKSNLPPYCSNATLNLSSASFR